MASSPTSASASSLSNPFVATDPTPLAAASVQLVNIRAHVPIVLELDDANYNSWRTFFEMTLRKFGLLDHVDGTVDARLRLLDAEWTQIDYAIVSWLYTSVSKAVMDVMVHPSPTAFSLWTAIRGLFRDNSMQRAVYALQEFHSLYQGDMTITEYFTKLKTLADTLNDVGHPISDQALVINALRGLSSKFSHAIGVLTSKLPPPTFLYTRSYLLQDETRQVHTAKMEAATALLAAGSASAALSTGAAPTPTTPSFTPSKTNHTPSKKKRKQSDVRIRGPHGGISSSTPAASQVPWALAYNPWTGVVQAWPLPQWRSAGSWILGTRPGVPAHSAMMASTPLFVFNNPASFGPMQPSPSVPSSLLNAFQHMPPPGSDWVLDIGASAHMASNPGILTSTSPAPVSSHIIVGNGAVLPIALLSFGMPGLDIPVAPPCSVLFTTRVSLSTRQNFIPATLVV
ncbi:uncharacterized protein LOC133914863 [Phragmites australis]|uniref:uncharacterized protein LOC133914863 n=1 Tax=Phragmites australis TaxID=29695 RepID=UPI002D7828D1|nr:uncharacterized protein LOC133914863 [Phragmites australis]